LLVIFAGNYYGTPLPHSQLSKINSNGVTANGSGEDYNHNEAPLSVGIPVTLPLSGNNASVTDHSLSPGESSAVYNSIYYTAHGDEGDGAYDTDCLILTSNREPVISVRLSIGYRENETYMRISSAD
jgi:hypothetical protein